MPGRDAQAYFSPAASITFYHGCGISPGRAMEIGGPAAFMHWSD
jgi:hypothetical protein